VPAGYSISFFSDDINFDDSSAAQREEKKIVEFLFNDPIIRQAICEHLLLSSTHIALLGVKEPIITNPNRKPGDVDILLCNPSNPHEATAIECKRVKVIATDAEKDKVNKIAGIADGVKQANALKNLGFYKTYLALLIVVDGQRRRNYNVFFRGSTSETFQQVYHFPDRERLHKDIGILFIEIIQPTSKGLERMVDVAIALDRPAESGRQPLNLTNKIEELC
jgi:hypothetical protein